MNAATRPTSPARFTYLNVPAVTRDGALLVSEDANGAIFRVTRK